MRAARQDCLPSCIAAPGHRDHAASPLLREAGCQRAAIHVRQVQAQQDDIGAELCPHLQRSGGGPGMSHHPSGAPYAPRQGRRNRVIGLNQQQAERRRRGKKRQHGAVLRASVRLTRDSGVPGTLPRALYLTTAQIT